MTLRDFRLDQDFELQFTQLSDLLSARTYCLDKVGSHEMEENRKEMSEKVNEITANKNYNLLVTSLLDTMISPATPLTQLFDLSLRSGSRGQRENRTSQLMEAVCHLVSLSFYKSVDEKVEEGEVNFTIGIFSKNYNGFVTDFFSMVDMRNKGHIQKKKKFLLSNKWRENPDLYLVVMVMLVDVNQANKCKAIGMMKMEQFLGDNSEKQIMAHTIKDCSLSVIDQIQRIQRIADKDKTESHEFKFKIKEIKDGSNDANDFLFMRGDVPGLDEKNTGINKLFLSIESGKFTTGARQFFGDTFNMSLDVTLLDENNQPVEGIRTSESGVRSSSYKAITCPDNNKCDWREVVQIGTGLVVIIIIFLTFNLAQKCHSSVKLHFSSHFFLI